LTASRPHGDQLLESLCAQIRDILADDPGMTEKHLRMLLQVDKRTIRQALRSDNRFVAAPGFKPRWYLQGEAPPPVSVDVQRHDLNDRDVVMNLLTEILRQQPGSTAIDLAQLLGLTKKEVNRYLYYSNGRFTQAGPNPPRWFIAEEAEIAEEREVVLETSSSMSLSDDWFDALERDYESLIAEDDDGGGEVITIAPPSGQPSAPYPIDDVPEREPLDLVKRATSPRAPAQIVEPTSENPFALYTWQRAALDAWRTNGHRGIIDAVTGAGKTRLAIAAIAEHTDLGGKVVVLVPTISLIHQWYEAIEALLPDLTIGLVGGGYDDSLDDVDVLISTVASARNRTFILSPGEVGLLVADECHRMASTVNRQALDARFTKRLGLSATHERMDDLHTEVLLPYFAGVTYSLGYREAIDDGVIANVRVAFVGVEFTPEETESYRDMTERLSSLRRKLVGRFGCRPAPFSAFLDDVLALTRKGDRQEGMAANAWLTTWRARRELLAETPAKVEALTAMIGAIDDSIGTMIFTQSIESANDIEDELSALGVQTGVHHSEISDYERGEILEAFGERRLKAIVSVQTLEEGVDVPDADLAIIVAASKQRRQMIQRMGRVMRQKADGRDARFVILYVEDTDEDPRLGAHELFTGDLIGVAREVQAYSQPDSLAIKYFLQPDRSEIRH